MLEVNFTKNFEIEKILLENILKILEQFWISCKVTEKILKSYFREILQKFSKNLKNLQIQKMLK